MFQEVKQDNNLNDILNYPVFPIVLLVVMPKYLKFNIF